MVKKIRGFTTCEDEPMMMLEDAHKEWNVPAVLVVTDERVFTESEVRAIAMQAIGMIKSAAKTGIHVGQACGYIGKSCLDAGIVLDPA
jgi:hypothetical protein